MDYIEATERNNAIEKIRDINKNIFQGKIYKNNFMFGVFYNTKASDLEIINYNSIPKSMKGIEFNQK